LQQIVKYTFCPVNTLELSLKKLYWSLVVYKNVLSNGVFKLIQATD